MNKSRAQLIAELAADAQPVSRPGRVGRETAAWLVLSAAGTALALAWAGPWRPQAAVQLLHSAQFFTESMLGVAAIIALGVTAFQSGIPSPTPMRRRAAVALLLLAAWLVVQCYGLIDPALAPSMAGKRGACWLEALLYGVPGLALGCWWLRRGWPLHGAWSGALIGLAAGAMPALMMQFACMYAPLHIIAFHLAPGLALGIVGSALGTWILRRH